tara:strand:+ start:55 stop:825 length:771 start_codon:yes stop_codon:yes gene_type:complete
MLYYYIDMAAYEKPIGGNNIGFNSIDFSAINDSKLTILEGDEKFYKLGETGGSSWTGNKFTNGAGISIGTESGAVSQGSRALALGFESGKTNQSTYAVAIGKQSGKSAQSNYAVALGLKAGEFSQGDSATAIGELAGNLNMGAEAVSIGYKAGMENMGAKATAIGSYCCPYSMGANSLAIGNYINNSSSHPLKAGVIAINATGLNRNFGWSGDSQPVIPETTYIDPIRQDEVNASTKRKLYYNPTTFEVVYGQAQT